MSVMIVTSLGELVIDLHTDRCPLTSKNFLKLCKTKYYNGCLFHTVQKDFTAQTGDPTGTGTGGDSIYKFLYGDQARFFGDEIHLDLKHTKMGTVAMANAGENLNASQFYITLRDDLDYLDGKKTVFGEVVEGLETLTRINEAYVDEKNRPYKNIRIKHTYILDDPFEDPPQLAEHIPDASPEGKPKDEVDDEVRLEDDWVPLDEQLDANELEEVIRAKEAHSRAVVLETIGDLPEAEVKPPDNVLFVCKLNPVTEDDDLNTIFSRFGTVTSAEIIRDFKTGDSLCYAFIEFEDKEACEQAYFKMDNALIDDRRIHVDFSQSVSKLWNQFRSKGKHGGTAGKGCFKCGSLDHIARDCTGSPDAKRAPKYTLKDDSFTRKGGNDSSRYDMVFDEETGSSPQRKKQPRHHEADDRYEQRKGSHRAIDERKQNDYKRKDVGDERRKEQNRRDDDRYHRSGERKEYKRDERDYRSRNDDRYRSRDDDRRRDSRDDRKRCNDDEDDRKKEGRREESYSRKIREDDVGQNKKSRGEDRDNVKSSKMRYDDREHKSRR
ncbi:Cyclophilin-like peptidyl-prolyl cis-trans isomerase domain-containing protein [Artemisia annua]|uniref:Peptidyl-prolyl cis-trans isomerase n=1 Tax=Artemisia annua TaxID=35608 RepID=A0A2U1QLU2_ARTAN|nr:Cyclophilin-like peptidyl-prolyl cis-trans isomerase domain-containing protein [Artemisia annua]